MENLKGQSSGKNWQNFLKLSSQQETPWLFLAVALSLHHLTAPDKSKKQCKHIQTISNNQITRPDADSFTSQTPPDHVFQALVFDQLLAAFPRPNSRHGLKVRIWCTSCLAKIIPSL